MMYELLCCAVQPRGRGKAPAAEENRHRDHGRRGPGSIPLWRVYVPSADLLGVVWSLVPVRHITGPAGFVLRSHWSHKLTPLVSRLNCSKTISHDTTGGQSKVGEIWRRQGRNALQVSRWLWNLKWRSVRPHFVWLINSDEQWVIHVWMWPASPCGPQKVTADCSLAVSSRVPAALPRRETNGSVCLGEPETAENVGILQLVEEWSVSSMQTSLFPDVLIPVSV